MLLVDTSVLLKWFRSEGEPEVEAARALLAAHVDERAQVVILDLAVYELGNVLVRALREPPALVQDTLSLLLRLCGPPVIPQPSWHAAAVDLAARHRLTFYDASWAAAAEALDCPLVTADRALLAAGLGRTATAAAAALPG